MNTKSLLTRLAVPVLSLGLLGGIGATLATSASAATVKPVIASTHLNGHPDTTSLPAQDLPGATVDSPNGPVWAYDNMTEKYTITSQGGNQYSVAIDFVGSFHGFADPTNGRALSSDGSVKGTISYTVTSPNAPDPSLLPGQSDPNATLSQNISTLFGGTVTFVGYGPYNFSYQNGNYVQNQPAVGPYTATGDVTGH
jgi:hypothetical protein